MTTQPGVDLKSRPNQRVVGVDSSDALARAAARLFASASRRAVDERGRFLVALAGGRTPQAMYRCLAQDEALRSAVPWHHVHVFWGDERCVGPDHEDSNYRMAHETLLAHVPIPTGQTHRMPADDPEPDRGARAYELELRRVFELAPGQSPVFDLILLGMGTDGHTASLFPGVAIDTDDRLVVAPFVEQLRAHRLTVTPAVLVAAREVHVLVAGAEKARTLAAVLHGPHDPAMLPIQYVADSAGQVTWMVHVGPGGGASHPPPCAWRG